LAAMFGVGGTIVSLCIKTGSGNGSADSLLVLVWISFVIIAVFGLILRFAMNMALDRIALDAYIGKKTKLISLLPLLSIYIVVLTLFMILTALGYLLIIVPGVIWFMKYNFVDLIVLDTRLGVIDAFKRSNQITYGHKWYLCGVYAVALLLMFVSIITIFGPFILMFVYVFSRAYIYRKLVEAHDKDIAQFTAVPPVSA